MWGHETVVEDKCWGRTPAVDGRSMSNGEEDSFEVLCKLRCCANKGIWREEGKKRGRREEAEGLNKFSEGPSSSTGILRNIAISGTLGFWSSDREAAQITSLAVIFGSRAILRYVAAPKREVQTAKWLPRPHWSRLSQRLAWNISCLLVVRCDWAYNGRPCLIGLGEAVALIIRHSDRDDQ